MELPKYLIKPYEISPIGLVGRRKRLVILADI